MMLPIFLKTLPFFLLIGLGWLAGKFRLFSPEATQALTRFVFYVALSAMLFSLTLSLPIAEIWDPNFAKAYICATGLLFAVQFALSKLRGVSMAEATIEAQCSAIGNTGFLGIPMLAVLLGPVVAGPILLVISIDMIVFSSLVTLMITFARGGRGGIGAIFGLVKGLLSNPMILSMTAGFLWAAWRLPMPDPVEETLGLLSAAATPCALFAIGASLADRSAERIAIAGWLSLSKLVFHPALAAVMALFVFQLPPNAAGAMIAAAALPVAGNIYILAQHYGVAPARVSASILISTAASILTIPPIIAWVSGL